MNSFEMISAYPKQILSLAVDSQQALGLGNRFEAANLTFLLSCVLVRDLSSVVLVLTGPMVN